MRPTLTLFGAALLLAGCVNIAPAATLRPINLQSTPPFELPSGLLPQGNGSCALISPQEMGTIFGSAPVVTDDSGGDCTFTFGNASTVVISIERDSDLEASRFLFGNTARDITVGNLPAITGSFLGQPAVHVLRGSEQLQVQGLVTGSDEATIAKLVQVASIAVSRWR